MFLAVASVLPVEVLDGIKNRRYVLFTQSAHRKVLWLHHKRRALPVDLTLDLSLELDDFLRVDGL
jgi:hypothetical protein